MYPQGQNAVDGDHDAFDCIKIGIASPQRILSWSRGEVTKPETINYRTLKPEMGGLFCERIFGPSKDWECYCGKYKRVRHRGIICERCGVEVTESKVRRHRMGHIKLAAPVIHIWYLKGIPSYLSLLLDIPLRHLEDVTYYNAYIVLQDKTLTRSDQAEETYAALASAALDTVDEDLGDDLPFDLAEEEDVVVEPVAPVRKLTKKAAAAAAAAAAPQPESGAVHLRRGQILSEDQYDRLCMVYGEESFEAEMGAPALKRLLGDIDLRAERDRIWEELKQKPTGQKKVKLVKRLRVIENFVNSGALPTWMVLDAIPVIPPDLRPMVQLDGGRFATSDLNDLYRRVINRNNRLNRLLEMEAPDIIIRNEKRMLQEAVDALFDNGRRGRVVVGPNNRPLKSLSDIVEGKQGRFRQNLLGKRVDYSGRSVIVVGPSLRLNQCGLPKEMALELFKPFVMNKLVEHGVVQNIKSAKKLIERQETVVWDILEDVIKGHPVLLNRAPTLHRLGIQAFEPVLVEGRAIQLHPLVCTAFNADFDGDQMAVHVPLSIEAQTEARLLMMATNNILLPATGRPIVTPSQDMVIGCYYITVDNPEADRADSPLASNGKVFGSPIELLSAFQLNQADIHAKAIVRFPTERLDDSELVMTSFENSVVLDKNGMPVRDENGRAHVEFNGRPLGELRDAGAVPATVYVRTTAGRILLNDLLPEEFTYQNKTFGKEDLADLIAQSNNLYGSERTAELANALKDAGFGFATKAGVSISIADLEIPKVKESIITAAEGEIEKAEHLYNRGKITETERYTRAIRTWHEASERLTRAIREDTYKLNSVYMMAFSGARGNISQVRQLIGMRGLMADPNGRILDMPIKSNFKEGLNVTEYVLSSYGARKGIVDTALRTADSGYLTRRLADVAQDVIILDEDCGTLNSFKLRAIKEGDTVLHSLRDRLIGRTAAEDIFDANGKQICARNQQIDEDAADALAALRESTPGEDQSVAVRSPMGCESDFGVCRNCYGWSLTSRNLVDRGEPVGIISAQSIGEPGTQLTMRTFHTGGVFEGAGSEKLYSTIDGKVSYNEADYKYTIIRTQTGENEKVLDQDLVITIIPDAKKKKPEQITILPGFALRVADGDVVKGKILLAESISESGKFGKASFEKKQKEVVAGISGQIVLDGIETDTRKNRSKQQDETIVTSKEGILWIYSGNVYTLPPKCEVRVKNQDQLKEGDTIASIGTATEYGGRVSLSKNPDGSQSLAIVTAELELEHAIIDKQRSEGALHFLDEELPVRNFELFIDDKARLESNQTIAKAADARYRLERNGVVFYTTEVNEKEPLVKEVEVLFLHEESYTLRDKTPFVEEPTFVAAGTEIIQETFVEESGFISIENLDTSQELLFYPGARAYNFSDDEQNQVLVHEEDIVKKNKVIGKRWNPETEQLEEVKAEIDGFVQILPVDESESVVVIRPFTKYKVKPIDKFFQTRSDNEKIGLEPVTRMLHRKGDRVKAGSSLARIELHFRLQAPLLTLGGRVNLNPSEEHEGAFKLTISAVEVLSSQKGSMRGTFLPEYQEIDIHIEPLVKDGQIVPAKHPVASTAYRVQAAGTVTVHQDEHSGLIRMMLLTNEHSHTYPIQGAPLVKVGDKIFAGDALADGAFTEESGEVTEVTKDKVMLRRARPYLISQGSQLVVTDNSMVRQGEEIAILTYEQMKTGDIIQGLPRVEELLETRKPKETCLLSEYEGTVVAVNRGDDDSSIKIQGKHMGSDMIAEHTIKVAYNQSPIVMEGQHVVRGERLTTGSINPHELLKIMDVEAAQRYLVDSVQLVYRNQGVKINDRHIEVIVRQMTRKCRIDDPGESIFLPGEIATENRIRAELARMREAGISVEHIEYTPILLGITKASLNTESFISAASFQETTRVLTEAAVEGKRDWLRGLKENVIIGRLIPAGTGMRSRQSRDDLLHKQMSVQKAAEAAMIIQEANA
jgi:DNA-directed RNA polymerase subunit beta'